ncbi:MAG: NYN domain-containing protein [Nitrospinota bacterium]|nr:NYN domain-containing protein [Nitrospinota bacterium]
MHTGKFAILLDGAFVSRRLNIQLSRFPKAGDVVDYCEKIKSSPRLKGLSLLRIYFYDAPPATEEIINPVDDSRLSLAGTDISRKNDSLIKSLQLKDDFALRLGEASLNHDLRGFKEIKKRPWMLKGNSLSEIIKQKRPILASDLKPHITQKGVDLRIGLDIARLSLLHLVEIIVVVTGDSDMVPALKFARREGIRVYLDYMDGAVKNELKVHADVVLDVFQAKQL